MSFLLSHRYRWNGFAAMDTCIQPKLNGEAVA